MQLLVHQCTTKEAETSVAIQKNEYRLHKKELKNIIKQTTKNSSKTWGEGNILLLKISSFQDSIVRHAETKYGPHTEGKSNQ